MLHIWTVITVSVQNTPKKCMHIIRRFYNSAYDMLQCLRCILGHSLYTALYTAQKRSEIEKTTKKIIKRNSYFFADSI